MMSIEQAARILGVSRSAAYGAAHRGEIPSLRIGRRIVVPVARLQALLGIANDHPACSEVRSTTKADLRQIPPRVKANGQATQRRRPVPLTEILRRCHFCSQDPPVACRRDHGTLSKGMHDDVQAREEVGCPSRDAPGPDGRRERLYEGGFATKREAQKAEIELKSRISNGSHVNRSAMTVAQYFMDWVDSQHDLKPTTHQSYLAYVKNHIVPQLGHVRMQDLTATDLSLFYSRLLTDGRIKQDKSDTEG